MTASEGALRHLDAALAELRRQGLLRLSESADVPSDAVVLCSNDYLGYAKLPLGAAAAAGGAGASRLVCGDTVEHRKAERALANWLDADAALLFSSGYAANVGVITGLVGLEIWWFRIG